ncbi:MAG: hypothetical protein NC131_15240 [Roseburia sp.]|nr:hypothetical protein [Roseburia sp.]
MQQTKHYKLNKPEMDDTFAVAPLNENADLVDTQLAALDGRVAAADAKHCLFRLPDPAVTAQDNGCSIDLSGLGHQQYDALLMVYYFKGATGGISISINDLGSLPLLAPHAGDYVSGCGCAFFMPANGYVHCLSNMCNTYSSGGGSSGESRAIRLALEWADLKTFVTNRGGTDHKLAFFGLKF